MGKRVSLTFIMLAIAGSSLIVQAQQNRTGEVQSELSLIWGMARGSFGDNLDQPIPGVLFSFGGRTPDLPLVLKTELGWMNYGFGDHLELRLPDLTNPDAPAVSLVNVETSNNIVMAHLVARLVPFRGRITPYIGGLIGFKYLTSIINIESEALFDDDNIISVPGEDRLSSSTRFDSFALSYGAGAGVDIQIYNGSLGIRKKNYTITMHMGVRYLFGEEADYLTENSIRPETDRIFFEEVRSDTDMLIPELGIQIGL